MAIKKGDKIRVDYEGRLENGEVFDSSMHGEHSHPLEFTAGAGEMIKGFDDAVIGMKVNEEKEIKLKPKDAYGERKKELEQHIPLDVLPHGQKPEVGMTLVRGTQHGHQMPVKIIAVHKEKITIDLNHPLAGKTLIFKIKIVEIES